MTYLLNRALAVKYSNDSPEGVSIGVGVTVDVLNRVATYMFQHNPQAFHFATADSLSSGVDTPRPEQSGLWPHPDLPADNGQLRAIAKLWVCLVQHNITVGASLSKALLTAVFDEGSICDVSLQTSDLGDLDLNHAANVQRLDVLHAAIDAAGLEDQVEALVASLLGNEDSGREAAESASPLPQQQQQQQPGTSAADQQAGGLPADLDSAARAFCSQAASYVDLLRDSGLVTRGWIPSVGEYKTFHQLLLRWASVMFAG